jgi:S-formylglutathione hydrolase FrmB
MTFLEGMRLRRTRIVQRSQAALPADRREYRLRIAAIAIGIFILAGCDGGQHGIRYRIVGHEQVALPGVRGAPLLVLLHGRSADPGDVVNGHLVTALKRLGRRAPSVVVPDDDGSSYWHDRRSGRWGNYVLRHVIPEALRRLHADPRRVAIGGISMGGFGAIDLARLAPTRFCAVGARSSALWRTGGQTPEGAFDDAEDFARHDVVHLPFRYSGPLWMDVGTDDSFRRTDVAFARAHYARLHVWPGGHDWSYWNAHWDAYLRFVVHSCS